MYPMPALPLRNSEFVRIEVDEACASAKHTLSGPCVDGLGEWQLDSSMASWAAGKAQKTSKAVRDELTEAWSGALADALDKRYGIGDKPGEFAIHKLVLSSNAHAIIIARRVNKPDLGKLDLDFWCAAFAEKTWLVHFSAGLQKAYIFCPFVPPTKGAVKTILAALETAVDLAEAILGVFETDPKAALTWQTWWCTSGQLILAEGGE